MRLAVIATLSVRFNAAFVGFLRFLPRARSFHAQRRRIACRAGSPAPALSPASRASHCVCSPAPDIWSIVFGMNEVSHAHCGRYWLAKAPPCAIGQPVTDESALPTAPVTGGTIGAGEQWRIGNGNAAAPGRYVATGGSIGNRRGVFRRCAPCGRRFAGDDRRHARGFFARSDYESDAIDARAGK